MICSNACSKAASTRSWRSVTSGAQASSSESRIDSFRTTSKSSQSSPNSGRKTLSTMSASRCSSSSTGLTRVLASGQPFQPMTLWIQYSKTVTAYWRAAGELQMPAGQARRPVLTLLYRAMICSSSRYSGSIPGAILGMGRAMGRLARRPEYPSGVCGYYAGDMASTGFTPEQVQRYARHLILPEVGGAGQRKLLNTSVLLLGAGGLGSPAAMYLAAAGIGRIGILDFDVVDASNLQRQILHGTEDLGRPKVESAAETLRSMNPDVEVIEHRIHINSENALDVFRPYDVIVDGTDNFPTRYLANDASFFLEKPLVSGAIYRFEGQVTVFEAASGTGCYRCLFPNPPPPGAVPSCAEAGVFGVLPGILGSMMAFETIKHVLGVGQGLVGKLLVFEGIDMDFRKLNLRRNPDCPLCGDNPTVTGLIDYEQFCGMPASEASVVPVS